MDGAACSAPRRRCRGAPSPVRVVGVAPLLGVWVTHPTLPAPAAGRGTRRTAAVPSPSTPETSRRGSRVLPRRAGQGCNAGRRGRRRTTARCAHRARRGCARAACQAAAMRSERGRVRAMPKSSGRCPSTAPAAIASSMSAGNNPPSVMMVFIARLPSLTRTSRCGGPAAGRARRASAVAFYDRCRCRRLAWSGDAARRAAPAPPPAARGWAGTVRRSAVLRTAGARLTPERRQTGGGPAQTAARRRPTACAPSRAAQDGSGASISGKASGKKGAGPCAPQKPSGAVCGALRDEAWSAAGRMWTRPVRNDRIGAIA